MPLELPAVTVPPARNAGFSEASFSAEVSGRGCSSRSTPATGTSSSANRPAASAAAQRCCERSANASWSSRMTPHRSATFSPVSPIASVENRAAYAGFTNRQPSVVSCSVRSPRSNGFAGFAVTSGARVIDSTPPATNRSPSPAIDRVAGADDGADRPEAHSRFTVTPPTLSGSPASSAANRATLRLSSPAWFAQPSQTSSISPAGTPLRSTAAAIAAAARSSGRTPASPPP